MIVPVGEFQKIRKTGDHAEQVDNTVVGRSAESVIW